jgi:hypothetical protein
MTRIIGTTTLDYQVMIEKARMKFEKNFQSKYLRKKAFGKK